MCPQLSKEAVEKIRDDVERHYDKELTWHPTAIAHSMEGELTAVESVCTGAGLSFLAGQTCQAGRVCASLDLAQCALDSVRP
jgi:hypothetical protein